MLNWRRSTVSFARIARMDIEQVKAEQDKYQILQQMKQARLHEKV